MKQAYYNLLAPLVLLGFGAATFLSTYYINDFVGLPVGAAIWPRICAVTLMLGSAAYLAQVIWQDGGQESITLAGIVKDHANPVIVLFAFMIFLLLLPLLGMLIGLVIFCFATMVALGPKDWKSTLMHAALSIGVIGAGWFVFSFALGVILPGSRLFGL